MCGIAGIFSSEATLFKEQIEAMTLSLSHRGPDHQGTFESGRVGLGHRRLSIIDLSTDGNQPMTSSDGRYTIVYNGELYNYKDIASSLNLRLTTSSDTEVVLEAFVKKGPEVVRLFNGMFSFALYDKEKETLWIFRDRMGKKPLFYSQQGDSLLFASELKALVPFLKNFKLDKDSVALFLHLGFIPGERSIYASVKKLPMGSGLSFDGKDLSVFQWWKPVDEFRENSVISQDPERQLKDILTDSVRLRLVSDVPYGSFLSGGIDSSVVSAIAQEQTGGKLKTFTIGFSDAKSNEAPFAAEIAKYLGTEHYEKYISEREAIDHLPDIINHFDEPFADTSALPTWILARHTREHVTMALSGDGGDELFSGYGTADWARRTNVPDLIRPVIKNLLLMGSPRIQRGAYHYSRPANKAKNALILSQELYFFTPEEIANLMKVEYSLAPPVPPDVKLSLSGKQSLFEMTTYLPDDLLVKVDRCSMKEGLEVRCPLLDYRLVNFALNLPDSLKEKRGVKKYILKQVLFGYIPEKFFQRPKQGFSVPLDKWLKTDLHFLVEKYLNKESVETAGILNNSLVQNYLSKFAGGKTFLYNRIWNMVVLQSWLSRNRYE